MKGLLVAGGALAVLDYSHDRIEWDPLPPPAMARFYDAFLRWRKDAGMNNALADELPSLFGALDLEGVTVTDQSEVSSSTEPDFQETAGIWTQVAETRGRQMVNDGYLSEEQRIGAVKEYQEWLRTGRSMRMVLAAAVGYRRA
jgi:hypothetical protein